MDYKKNYLDIVKTRVKESRYIHTLGVIETAVKLAKIYNVDIDKTRIAASLHDIAKYIDIDKQKEIIHKNFGQEFLDSLVPQVYHGPVAYVIARDELNIDDQDILNAIMNHTIGRIHMSTLEKIIFVADFSEPNREFKEAKICLDKAIKSLDEAVYYALDQQLRHLESKGYKIAMIEYDVRDYYRRLTNLE
ncbi:bis(5'-nucleosyl)-tetraphosphatase (symmetrical) YqeK [bacterium]|nr:bis(5'-nucleosyl)-tetraphosphatase (symmetrical) YqeK [bacterium]